MIEEFEKSELSIRLADKMYKMERTWEWLSVRNMPRFLIRVKGLFKKVKEMSRHLTDQQRVLIQYNVKFAYYLVIAIIAYASTMEQSDYYMDENQLDYPDLYVPFIYHLRLIWAIMVFLVLLI